MDYGPPIRLRPGKGNVLKIKRGGTGKISNSGTEKKRVRPPVIALRDKNGKHLPKPERGATIWDPRDPFIVEYRKAHPVVEADWRNLRAGMTTGLISQLTPDQQARALGQQRRRERKKAERNVA